MLVVKCEWLSSAWESIEVSTLFAFVLNYTEISWSKYINCFCSKLYRYQLKYVHLIVSAITCMEINWCTANGQLSAQGSTKPQVFEGISYKRPGPFKNPVKTVC